MDKADPISVSPSPVIQFGRGRFKGLGDQAKSLNATKALVVTDPGILELDIIDEMTGLLNDAEIEPVLFSDIQLNPTDANVNEGVRVYKESGCDLIVAIGGGSPMDAAKGTRVLAGLGGSISEYDMMMGGVGKITGPLPPMIAVPTTAGTGSEATIGAIMTIPEVSRKIAVVGQPLMPTIAIIDPELSAGMPPGLTAGTGMDALSHCIEAYSVIRYNPIADNLALGGIELVGSSLVDAYKNGSDLDARTDMAMAALLGGIALNQKSLGACHALSHQITAIFGVPHGVANSIMLPHVMDVNLPSDPARFLRMANCLEPGVQRLEDVPKVVSRLSKEIGLPQTLSEVGVKEDSFDLLAGNAMMDFSLFTNPVSLDLEKLKDLLRRAF
jgi:alcohol dehydrogenase class IV